MVKRKTSHLEKPSPGDTTFVVGDGIYGGTLPLAPMQSSASASNDGSNAVAKPLNTEAIAAGFANAIKLAVDSHRAEGRPVYSIGSDNIIKKS
jgi:hypothetical protein